MIVGACPAQLLKCGWPKLQRSAEGLLCLLALHSLWPSPAEQAAACQHPGAGLVRPQQALAAQITSIPSPRRLSRLPRWPRAVVLADLAGGW